MFTLEQIKAAHSKVKSGADFPAYIRDLKQLGVTYYETFVSDGHTIYSGNDNFSITSPPRYEPLTIAAQSNTPVFTAELKAHQQGKSDYLSFIRSCATFGVEKWAVCLEKMTCIYYDKTGKEILVEQIPA